MDAPHATSRFAAFAMAGAILATVLFAAAAIKMAPTLQSLRAREHLAPPTIASTAPGVVARVTAGDQTVELTMPELNFTVSPDQSLDPRLPPGPFEGRFEATFMPGLAPTAAIGAEVQGGSVRVKLEDSPLVEEAPEGTDLRRVMSRPIPLRMRPYTITYIFRSYGVGTARLRALWQPEDADMPMQLPGAMAGSEVPRSNRSGSASREQSTQPIHGQAR